MGNQGELQRVTSRARGRQRLMLRMPEHRGALTVATAENFLDLCEAYDLAWTALDHWSHKPDQIDHHNEYHDLIAALEGEVVNFVTQQRQK